jgi:hypothetical protein
MAAGPVRREPDRLTARRGEIVVVESGKYLPTSRRRAVIVRLFVRHNVNDYAAWRKVYDEFDEQRRPMCVTDDAVFQSIDDPTDVTLWHDFDSADQARAFVSSDELRNAMQKAGVQGEPQVWFVSAS